MDKKKIISIVILVVGVVVLGVGTVFLVLHLTQAPVVADGEYLVSAGEWVLNSEECSEPEASKEPEASSECGTPSVIWKFTEIGKGTLTTNNHVNDYDFAWALEDGYLAMRTNWLYELDNNYEYKLDQKTGELTLTADGKDYRFVAKTQ